MNLTHSTIEEMCVLRTLKTPHLKPKSVDSRAFPNPGCRVQSASRAPLVHNEVFPPTQRSHLRLLLPEELGDEE